MYCIVFSIILYFSYITLLWVCRYAHTYVYLLVRVQICFIENQVEASFKKILEQHTGICKKDLHFKEQIQLDVSPCSLWKVLHDGQPHMALVYNSKVANKVQFCDFIDDMLKEKQNVLKVYCAHLQQDQSNNPILLFKEYDRFQDYCVSYKLSEVEQLTILRDIALVTLYFQQQTNTKLNVTLQSIVVHKEGGIVTQALFLPVYQHSIFAQVEQPAESPAGYEWIKDALLLMVYQGQNIENNELPENHILFNIFKYKWFSNEKIRVSNNIFDVAKEISYILDLEKARQGLKDVLHSSDILEISHIHMILIGHTGVGKTSLRKHLQNIPFNEAERSTVVMEQELLHQETVEISANSSSIKFCKSEDVYKSEPDKCYLTLWDSGGQPMFQDLLPCFARLRSIFGIVFRLCDLVENSSPAIRPICSDEPEQESPYTSIDFVNRCLAFVQFFAPLQNSVPSELKATLFESQGIDTFPKKALIGTFKDKVRVDNPQLKEKCKLFEWIRESPRALLPESVESVVFKIDNTQSGKRYEDSEIIDLKKQLVACTRSAKAKIPSSWISFKIELEHETRIQQPCTGIMSFEKAAIIAKEYALDPVQPLYYFNELGVFLWYHNNDSLNDYVITDPKHLVNILGTVLNPENFAKLQDQWEKLKVRGVIDFEQAKKLLDSTETGLPVEWIFSFFEEHQLGISVSEGYFIPSMLQIVPHGCQNHLHDYDWVNSVCTVLSSTEVVPLFIVPQSECIPPGFFPRLMTVLAGIQDGNVIWELSTNNENYKNRVSFNVNNQVQITFTEFIECIRIHVSTFSDSTSLQKLCRFGLSQLKVQLQRVFPQASRLPVSVTFMCSKTQHFLPSPPLFVQDSAHCVKCDSNFELTEAHKVWLRPPPPKIASDEDAQKLLQSALKEGLINLQVSTMLHVGENSSFTHILFGRQTKCSLYKSNFYIVSGETVSALTHKYLSEFFACNAMVPQESVRLKIEQVTPNAEDIVPSELDHPSEHELDRTHDQSSIADKLGILSLEKNPRVTQADGSQQHVFTQSPKTTIDDSIVIGQYKKYEFKISSDNILQLMCKAHEEKYSIELFEGIECSNLNILQILPLLIQRTATFGVGNEDTIKLLQEMYHLPTKWIILKTKQVSSVDEFSRSVDITFYQKILPKHLALLSRKAEEREIPFAWFYFYHLIRNGFSEIKRKVMSMEEVSGIADVCHISVNQLPKVLTLLHELGFLLYYKDILPGVIFEDASVIIKTLTNAYQNDESIIDTSLLSQVYDVYYYNLFTVQDVTKLLQGLSVISKISDHTYCIPTLLKEKYNQQLTKNVQPLHIQCPMTPGVFEYLICYLTSEQVESIWPLKIRTDLSEKPTCLYKNCAELSLSGYDCTITLLASSESIKVYVDLVHEEPPLPKLTKSIISGLKKANSSYFYPETEIRIGFNCTCGLFDAEHTMVYHKTEQLLKCSRDTRKTFPISMSQKSLWFEKGTAEENDALNVHNVFKYLLPRCKEWYQIGLELSLSTRLLQDISTRCRDKHDMALIEVVKEWFKHSPNPQWKSVIKKDEILTTDHLTDVYTKLYDARDRWLNIGLLLKVSYSTLKLIEKEQHDESDRCLLEMLAHRIQSGGLTWTDLCDCLRKPTVGRSDLADKIASGLMKSEETQEKPKFLSQSSSNFGGISWGEKHKLEEANYDFDFRRILSKFSMLRTSTMDSIKSRNIPVEVLVSHLTAYEGFPAIFKRDGRLLADCHDDLKKANSTDKVFVIISPFLSFVDFEILEYIINHETLGTDRDRQNLAEYTMDLREFLLSWKVEQPTKIIHLESESPAKLCLKLDTNTLDRYRNLKGAIARILNIAIYDLHLESIDKGCIKLVFLFPEIAADSIHSLESLRDEFLTIDPRILNITLVLNGNEVDSLTLAVESDDGGCHDNKDKIYNPLPAQPLGEVLPNSTTLTERKTPLMFPVTESQSSIAKLLLSEEADSNKDNDSNTLYSLTRENEHNCGLLMSPV